MSILLQFLAILAVAGGLAYYRLPPMTWTLGLGGFLVMLTMFGGLSGVTFLLAWGFFLTAAVFVHHDKLRKDLVTRKIFTIFKRILPPMSTTEKEALEAGDVWWDGDLFRGNPDWQKWRSLAKPELSTEEQKFIDEKVEAVCEMIDDWKVTHEDADLPAEVWEYLKKERFFGMIIPKKYGGLEFSALAHSTVVSKIASRSSSAAVTTMVPNSLGPAELLLHYGTEEQKQRYLPGLASGNEIPCFALTSPQAGSDAGAIPDKGVICKGKHEGKEVVGISLTWDKRYITLAPVATVLGLAFKLHDPDGLLGDTKDYGITVALIPTSHPGVEIGKRHNPLSMAFQNGPTRGKDVFIPLDWIIGGPAMAGKGWRMLVECLSVGRAISLPALSTASGKLSYRMTGAYAYVRKQFKTSIGYFEGIQEAMGRIGGYTYILEAARIHTANAVDLKVKPSVISAIAKYHMTEKSRGVVIDAMDVHAGRGIILGPRNYLGRYYQGAPVGITVEGANILTRNLIIFGQGAIRCHPYVLQEMLATQDSDEENGFHTFDKVLMSHIGYGVSNFVRTFTYGLSGGRFIKAPVEASTAHYYKQLSRMSTALALVSDIAMLILGGELKRKERLSARLGDVLSALYLSSAVLKYYEDEGSQKEDLVYVRWCLDQMLYDMQTAFVEFFDNFTNKYVGMALKRVVFPYGLSYKMPADDLSQAVALQMMQPSEFRDRITRYCYVGQSSDDPTGLMENAFLAAVAAAPLEKRVQKAVRKNEIQTGETFIETIANALNADVINKTEAKQLEEAYQLCDDAIQVDECTSEYMKRENAECQNNLKAEVA